MIEVSKELLAGASFKLNGDLYEKKYGHLQAGTFPNCEKFWKLHVIPLTERINDKPGRLVDLHKSILTLI